MDETPGSPYGPPQQTSDWPYRPPAAPLWQAEPVPQRRSGGSLVAVASLLLVAAAGVTLGRPLLGQGGTPRAGGPPAISSSQVPSGRRPGVVDVDTLLPYSDQRAAGTGIVLSSDGVILTNNHVITGATTITVTDTDNGRTYSAHVIGYDRAADVAVLKAQGADRLRTAALGDSGKVAPGDIVTAVGNAGGKGGTPSVVSGSVTALGQPVDAQDQGAGTVEHLVGLIQISAPIQPGDSGGPLLNTAGQVIGMDTAASAGFKLQPGTGQGFAIPMGTALPIASQIERGQPSDAVHIGRTAFLGVQVRAGSASTGGARVSLVFPGTAAAELQLSPGALITSLDGDQITSPDALTRLLLTRHPGDTIQLGWTDELGRQHTGSVQLPGGPAQ